MSAEQWFERLAAVTADAPEVRAPARLKSKVYSAVVQRIAESGPLRDLRTTKDAGGHLCVFENALSMLPLGTDIRSMNPCRICHARVRFSTRTRSDRCCLCATGCGSVVRLRAAGFGETSRRSAPEFTRLLELYRRQK